MTEHIIPADTAPEEEVFAWHRELVAVTRRHVADGPKDNRKITAHLDFDAGAWDALGRGTYWAQLLGEGYESIVPQSQDQTDPQFGCRVSDHDGWTIRVKPTPELAAAWVWAARWYGEVYLPRHPDLALRDAISALCEEADCATWASGYEYPVWELLLGDRTSWMRFDVANSEHAEMLAAVRRAHEAAGGWWWRADGAGDPAFVSTSQWQQIYARTINASDRGLMADVICTDRTEQVYLGRKGIDRYMAEHATIFRRDDER